MSDLIADYDRDARRKRRARWWMVEAVAAVILFWLTWPYGVVLLLRGSVLGVALVAVALLSAVGGWPAFRKSRRLVPASDFVIRADASEQPDPAGASPLVSKPLGWVMTFLNR